MCGVLLDFEGCVGDATERNGKPEVDRPVGEYRRERLCIRQTEAHQHRDQDELHDAEATRRNRYGGQDIGQAVCHQQIHWGDEVAEGRHEYPK